MKYSNVIIETPSFELPHLVVSSDELEEKLASVYKYLKIGKGQLESLTGIRERRYWEPGFKMSDGGLMAARKALKNSRIEAKDIGMIIYAGVCRDSVEVPTSQIIANQLPISNDCLVYDISNACLGVSNGIVQIANAIELGQIKAGIIISCESAREIVETSIEKMNRSPDMDTFKKTIATLTGGSGAAAVIVAKKDYIKEETHDLIGGVIRNDVESHELCTWKPNTSIPSKVDMTLDTDPVSVLHRGVKLAIKTFDDFKKELSWYAHNSIKIVCHQVGASNQKQLLNALNIEEKNDFITYPFLGNIGTASLPITSAIASERGFFKRGDKVGMFGIGSGLNCTMLGIIW